MPNDKLPATGPAILERQMQLEQQFTAFLEEFRAYAKTAREERQELSDFINDDVRELLVQLADLGRKHRAGLTDLRAALALHLGDPQHEERTRERNGD